MLHPRKLRFSTAWLGEDATPCEALVLQRGAQPDRRSELARHHTVRATAGTANIISQAGVQL